MPTAIDLTGQIFNNLTVLYKDVEKSKQTKKAYWVCQCKCGNIKSIYANNLKTGHTQSCGCHQKQQASKANLVDLSGKVFDKLTVIQRGPNGQYGETKWYCKCDCGNTVLVYSNALTRKLTRSCGCAKESIGEKEIIKILEANNISYIREYKFKDLGNMRYDFYLPNHNRLIEFDGEQHYYEATGSWGNNSSLKERQNKDRIKNTYAREHNIDLVRIPYWQRDNITIDMLLGEQYLLERN